MKYLNVKNSVRLPDTNIILEKGDKIFIKKNGLSEELDVEVGAVPSDKIMVPYAVDLPGFGTGIINKGAEVKYVSYNLKEGFIVILFYNHLKHKPFAFEKIALIFNSKEEALSKGWNFLNTDNNNGSDNFSMNDKL